MSSEFFVEAVAYQQAAIEELERWALSVQAMHPMKDKRARLRVAARYIKNGTVKFPLHGCEQLLTQLLGFGVEKHDDAAAART
jgi:phage terminase large subunit-like protein